jgi:hypothetical protein
MKLVANKENPNCLKHQTSIFGSQNLNGKIPIFIYLASWRVQSVIELRMREAELWKLMFPKIMYSFVCNV